LAGLELTNFVLLACDFQILGEAAEQEVRLPRIEAFPSAEGEEVAGEEAEQSPGNGGHEQHVAAADETDEGIITTHRGSLELEGVSLRFEVQRPTEPNEFVLLLQAWLTERSAPFVLDVVTGSRFSIPEEDEPTLPQVAATLVFMTYPYLRETISAITARSPYQAMVLPPLSRLPHPRVEGKGASAE
jgi:hypothetical protein